eukprot:TRINITY_DN63804_c0_g1_i1.p1 TRINITY_DN63804_c0_g1~~TRINITY_DN63804_c0_g1_i1.p1  ORF type:complete len:300 (-),score=52.56 TRINITY_DN63804_c0_g1_i1:247-1146(-)
MAPPYKFSKSGILLLLVWQVLAAKCKGERPAVQPDEWQALEPEGKADCNTNVRPYPTDVNVQDGGEWLKSLLADPLNLAWADNCGYFRCRRKNNKVKDAYKNHQDAWTAGLPTTRIFVSKNSWTTKKDGDNKAFNDKENTMFEFMFKVAVELCIGQKPKQKAGEVPRAGYAIYMDWLDWSAKANNDFWSSYLAEYEGNEGQWDDKHIGQVQAKLADAINNGQPLRFYVGPIQGPFCKAELCCFKNFCNLDEGTKACLALDVPTIMRYQAFPVNRIALSDFRGDGNPDASKFAAAILKVK